MANRRLFDDSRRDPWWRGPKLWGALVGVAVVFGGLWVMIAGDDEPEGPSPDRVAVAEAGGDVAAGIGAARQALEGERAEAIMRERRERQARQVDYRPGESQLLIGELEPRESVYVAMVGRGLPDGSVHRVITAMEKEFDFRRSRAGDIWRAEVDESGQIEEFRYETSPEDIWVTRLEEDEGYVTEQKDVDVEVRHREVAGEVDGSFWLSITREGEDDLLAHRFMEVFRYTIDFNTETRDGDRYAMVVEEMYLDDEFLRYGRVVAAVYIGDRGPIQAYYFEAEDDEDNTGYFDEEGESLERQFLRSPLEVSRVTSGFGRREHPITGDQRMHQGVDYGAPTGTPVQSVADGTVTFAGWQGGYGNLLKIRHANGYETRYAHLSSFESGISPGVQVSQGDIVARSGNTGASTAPHLHYEMLRGGRHIDPLEVDAGSGEPLAEEWTDEFQAEVVDPNFERLHALLVDDAPEAAEVFAESGDL